MLGKHKKLKNLPINDFIEDYYDLYDNSPDMLVSVNAETTRILQCNRTFVETMGYSREELIGRPVLDIYHTSCLLKAKEAMLLFRSTGKIKNVELQLKTKDGKKIDVMLDVTAVRDEHGRIVMSRSSLRDITEFKHLEQIKHLSESRYATLQTARDAIISGNKEGNIIFWNQMAETMFGYKAEDVMGKPLTIIMPQRFHESHTRGMERYVSSGQSHIIGKILELFGLRKNGEEFPIELSLSSWIINNEINFTAIIRDITERKHIENSLRIFRNLIDQTHDSIFLVEPDSGNFIDINEKASLTLGYTKDELLAMSVKDIAPTIPDQNSWLTLLVGLKNKGNMTFESVHKRKNGTLFPVEVSVNYIQYEKQEYLIAIVRDVSTRKQLEAEREALLNHIPVNIMMFDRNMTVNWVNESMAKQFGFRPDFMIGKLWYDLVPPMKERRHIYEKVLSGLEMDFHAAKVIFPEGERYFDVHYRPVMDSTGSVYGMLIIGNDITERKQVDDQIQKYQKRLQNLTSELTLVEEKERKRIATELHDITLQSLAVSKLKLGSLIRHFGTNVNEDEDKLNQIITIINNTIQETRALVYELSPPVLYELGFEPAVEWLAQHMLKKYDIVCEFSDDGKPKPLDDDIRIVLFQAVRELLTNIGKHSRAKKAKISLLRKNNELMIYVEDDGVGISVSEYNDVSFKNGGFGLFNIKERLKLLGANIEIESNNGQGTKIILTAQLAK